MLSVPGGMVTLVVFRKLRLVKNTFCVPNAYYPDHHKCLSQRVIGSKLFEIV